VEPGYHTGLSSRRADRSPSLSRGLAEGFFFRCLAGGGVVSGLAGAVAGIVSGIAESACLRALYALRAAIRAGIRGAAVVAGGGPRLRAFICQCWMPWTLARLSARPVGARRGGSAGAGRRAGSGAARPTCRALAASFGRLHRAIPEAVPERRDVDDGDALHRPQAQEIAVGGDEALHRPGDGALQELVVVGVSASSDSS
jgi:hypothetical protein